MYQKRSAPRDRIVLVLVGGHGSGKGAIGEYMADTYGEVLSYNMWT